MPLHPQAVALLQLMDQLGEPPMESQTPTEARAYREARRREATEPIAERRDLDAGGVPARLYRAADPGPGLIVYLHGGGWVIGDLDSHDNVCRTLANASGHSVLSIDYRLAPEHPFPAPLTDATDAVRWAHEHAAELGCDPTRLAIAGDSAGGNLAAVVANLGVVPLRYQLLIYPVTDATCGQPSYVDNAEGYFLTGAAMRWFIGHYLNGTSTAPNDPRVSPLFAAEHVLAAAPPAMVISAEFDPLRDEADRYAERLAAAGVPTSHVRFSGMIHGFASLGDFIDDGLAALALGAAALKAELDRPGKH